MSNSANKNKKLKEFNNTLLSSKSPFTIREAYKTLRTNIVFSLPGNDSKSIGITSATRGEGKSTVAINLAISLAQIDKKVILIDCDMRLPTIVSKLGIKAEKGLSDYLSGSIETVPIKHLEDINISIISSGTIPPDSTALINSNIMRDLITTLKTSYDYIIIDFPPVNIVSDAVLLSELIDGYLLVLRHEYSEYQKITEMLRQMNFADTKIIGMVYNGKSEEKKYYRKNKYYRYYSKYYKHYSNSSPK